MFGVLLVDKEAETTSHDVVNALRRRLGTRRIGHAGTLDPLATGLLVVAVGPATRFLQYLPLEPKEYVATIAFGRATNTFDAEGETTAEGDVPDDLLARATAALPSFSGLIEQVPPVYSAIKVRGKPLYAYARAGEEIVPQARRVHIGAFELTPLDRATVSARIVCSGGTYIRSLAHDLGVAIGVPAFLAGLVRTGVGRFRREEGVPVSQVSAERILPLEEALRPMPMATLDEGQVTDVRFGRSVTLEDMGRKVALRLPDGRVFAAAVRTEEGRYHPECVIPAEAVI